jgi:hypothetical protein
VRGKTRSFRRKRQIWGGSNTLEVICCTNSENPNCNTFQNFCLFFGKTFMGNKNSDDAIPVEYVRKSPYTKVIETKNFNKYGKREKTLG